MAHSHTVRMSQPPGAFLQCGALKTSLEKQFPKRLFLPQSGLPAGTTFRSSALLLKHLPPKRKLKTMRMTLPAQKPPKGTMNHPTKKQQGKERWEEYPLSLRRLWWERLRQKKE